MTLAKKGGNILFSPWQSETLKNNKKKHVEKNLKKYLKKCWQRKIVVVKYKSFHTKKEHKVHWKVNSKSFRE